jgi:excisionase family DNA binding protein
MHSASTTEHIREQDAQTSIEPIAMRVSDACRFLGIGRSTLYVLIARGEVEIVKLGRSTLVVTESLRQLIGRRRKPSANAASDRAS